MHTCTTIDSLVKLGEALLTDAGFATPRLDAELLLGHIEKKSRLALVLDKKNLVTQNNLASFFIALRRRLLHEPIAYILGHKEFYGREFFVTHDTLIPRPDTEIIVEHCLQLLPSDQAANIIDLCTGTGVLAITLLAECAKARAVATDISHAALVVAQHNAERLGVASRLQFYEGDLFAPLPNSTKARLIVANPPYIGKNELASLPPSVRDYEPHLALDGGVDGLVLYRRILRDAPRYLETAGFLVMEIGFDQKSALIDLVNSEWSQCYFFKDLAHNDRGVVLQLR